VKIIKILRREEGSATIEFLAMVPLVFFIMMIFWQFLVAGYSAIVAQSAVNEAAKTYAVTNNIDEASLAASNFIDDVGGNLEFVNLYESSRSGNNFGLTLNVNLELNFVPEKIVGVLPSVAFERSVSGRVMD
jgi:Flp pilus assembly protein TadG